MISKYKTMPILMMAALTACSTYDQNIPLNNTQKYLMIANEAFRKNGATNVDIFRVGIKKNGIFEPSFMPILNDEIPVYLSTEAFSETTQKAVLDIAAQTGKDLASGKLELGADLLSKGTYKVLALRDMDRLVAQLNAKDNVEQVTRIAMYDEPRIVVAVAVAFGYQSQLNHTNEGEVNLSIPIFNDTPQIKLSGSQGNTSLVKLSDGTTFAYKLARLCWREGSDNKLIVAAIDVDRPSGPSDNQCPQGTFKNAVALQEAKAIQLLGTSKP